MTLFKNKGKNKNRPAVLYSIDQKINEAREKHETHFYYALEVDLVRSYCLSHYRALVNIDHKTDNIIVYKIYGYSLD